MNVRSVFRIAPVTPIFNGGPQRLMPEKLRVPTLKGEILWWLRAVSPLGCNSSGYTEMRDEAAANFGSTDTASDLRITLHSAAPERIYPARPFDDSTWKPREGFRYLAYGLEGRRFYPPEDSSPIILTLQCTKAETWHKTCAALWLMSRFGGWGGRTRRGMGGFALQQMEGDPPPEHMPRLSPESAGHADELAAKLMAGLNQVTGANAFAWNPTPGNWPAAPLPQHSCFASGCWKAKLFPLPGPTWLDALDELGCQYLEWRHCIEGRGKMYWSEDFDSACEYVDRGSSDGSLGAAFGLPLQFQFRTGTHAKARIAVRGCATAQDRRHRQEAATSGEGPRHEDGRRASPLFLRVLQTAGPDGKFFGLVHVFKSKFVEHPNDELEFYMKKKAEGGAWQHPSQPFPVDWSSVEGFFHKREGKEIYVR